MSEKKNVEKRAEDVKQAAGEKRSAVIYLGPAIAGVAIPGTVYQNGITPQMEETIKKVPAIKTLLVQVENTAKVRKALRDPQSAASACYKK